MNSKNLVLLFISLFSFTNLYSQDFYDGKFLSNRYIKKSKTSRAVGKHVSFQKEYNLSITTKYVNKGLVNKLKIISGDNTAQIELPAELNDLNWTSITDGLWINAVHEDEKFTDSYDKEETVIFHYVGYFMNLEPFDNSLIKNNPSKAKLGQLIEGFSIGLANTKPGEIRVIKISPKLAYGEKGGGNIPENSTLIYILYRVDKDSNKP